MATIVEAFHVQIHVEASPPLIDALSTAVQTRLTPGATVLQWAVVRTDPQTGCWEIEGMMALPTVNE